MIIAYTDGACSHNPGPAGVGVVFLDGEDRWELSEYLGEGTNNIAELTAVRRAVERAANRCIHVYTDSTYAIGVLQKGWKAKANRDLVQYIRELMSQNQQVKLIHVRGHSGDELNEHADRLAVRAVRERQTAEWKYTASSPK